MKFRALIDGFHFNPKKGEVKISLIATSHVSLDQLSSIAPSDESIRVILENEQTNIEDFPHSPIEAVDMGELMGTNEESEKDTIITDNPIEEPKDEEDEREGGKGGVEG